MATTITTPLYYVNDKPHLGSTYTTIACDAFARFNRLEGKNVVFVTGVDEHGQKIERTADLLNISPQLHCDQVSSEYKRNWQLWGITNDRFIRTSSKRHHKLVEQFFQRVQDSGDIYLGRQQGWYCVGCEEYKDYPRETEEPQCSIHKKVLEWRDEENLFFKLSRYQKQIENLLNDKDFLLPKSRKNEITNFVKNGLNDFSISRTNLNWGIEVPGYKGHTFYVWFDALVGYLSALLQEEDEPHLDRLKNCGWSNVVHVIGKDILRFHAVYWPAMCLSAGIELPKRVFGHGFLTREGQKMGKSIGNVLDPEQLLTEFGEDAVRWYLLKDIQFGNDGDFQRQRFIDLINNDLANTIGNLLNRTSTMSRKWFNEKVPNRNETDFTEHHLAKESRKTIYNYNKYMERLEFHKASESIIDLAIAANCYLNETAPWKLIKDNNNIEIVANDIYMVLETCRIIGLLINPIIPSLSSRILLQLGIQLESSSWKSSLLVGGLESGRNLPIPTPVMSKLEQ